MGAGLELVVSSPATTVCRWAQVPWGLRLLIIYVLLVGGQPRRGQGYETRRTIKSGLRKCMLYFLVSRITFHGGKNAVRDSRKTYVAVFA